MNCVLMGPPVMHRLYFFHRNVRHCRLVTCSFVNGNPRGITAQAFHPFRMPRLCLGCMILILALALIAFAHPQYASAAGAEVPFGEKVGRVFTNYDRIRPTIATAGLLKDGAVSDLKPLGFVAVLDLRGPKEGTASEKSAVESAGLRYFNIPVTERAPTGAQVEAFTRIVEDPANHPIVVHCHTASRVGAMWVLYQVRKGVPVAIAVEEGRTIGLQLDRENAVRARLVEPSLKEESVSVP